MKKLIAVGTMDACHDAKEILACLYFASEDGSPLSGPIVALTPTQARELAQSLIGTADDIEAGRVLRESGAW